MPPALPPYKIIAQATPSAVPELILPTATPSPEPATPSAMPVSTPAAASTPEQQVQEQTKNLPEPIASIIRPPLLLFSRLLPGQYYQSFRLPLPYTLLLLGIAAGLVSAGLLLIRV